MMKNSFIIILLYVAIGLASDDVFGTFVAGPRGALLALHDVADTDSVSLLQGVGYVEIKIASKVGVYKNSLVALPKDVSIDSIALVVEDGLSLKVFSVTLVADSLRVIKKNNKAMVLLTTNPVQAFRYEFDRENATVAEPKNPELSTIAQYGRDGLVFVELGGSDLSESIVSTQAGRVVVDAKVTFMKKYLPLLGGYAARVDEGGFYISYDTSKAQFTIKSVVDDRLVLSFTDKRELDIPEIAYWKSSKEKKVIALPEVVSENSFESKVVELPNETVEAKGVKSADPVFESFQLYVIKDDINARAEPSTKSRKVSTVSKGSILTASGENKKWYKVLLESGSEAWIHKDFVKKKNELSEKEAKALLKSEDIVEESLLKDTIKTVSEDEMSVAVEPAEDKSEVRESVVFLIKDNVNIRTAPKVGTETRIIGAFKKGTRLVSLEKKNNWDKVRLENGDLGWVYSKFVLDSGLVTAEMWDSFYNSGKAEDDFTVELSQKDSLKSSDETFDIGSKPNVFKVSEEDNEVATNKAAADSVEVQKENEKKKSEALAIKYKKYGRDPFLPLDVKNLAKPSMPKVDDLTLIGVIYSKAKGAQNFALFEEKLKSGTTTFSLKEGEAIEDGKLLHIEENRVVFLMREADFTYTVEKIMENIDE